MSQSDAATAPTVFDDPAPELSRSYAVALINAAEKQGNVDEVLDELDGILSEVFGRFPEFAELLSTPVRNGQDNDQLLVKTFEGKTLPTVVNFLRVLNGHGRMEFLGPIVQAARSAWDRRQNRKPVTVTSAVPLDEGQIAALRDRLAHSLNATPVLRLEVDPSLIGGLVVQVGDDVHDASVRSSLGQLRDRLFEGKTHEIQSRRDHFRHSE
ncbi:MAG: ATP synthase F1 subunit delta [Isosphaeraceae bacterium]